MRYVELRTIDLNPFAPIGVEADQLRVLEAFLVFCLLHDSPPVDAAEQRRIDTNQRLVATRGRDPTLRLQDGERREEVIACAPGVSGCATIWLRSANGWTPPATRRAYAQALASGPGGVGQPPTTPPRRGCWPVCAKPGWGFFTIPERLPSSTAIPCSARPLAAGTAARTGRPGGPLAARAGRSERAAEQSPFEEYLQTYRDKLHHA